MTSETIRVPLGERSYDVRVGVGLIEQAAAEIGPLLHRPRVAILTDETVAAAHLEGLTQALAKGGIDASALVLPAGEATKSWAHLEQSVEWLLARKRSSETT